jgi:hypothetical protein
MMQEPKQSSNAQAVDSLVWRLVLWPACAGVITYGSFVPSNVMVMADGWLTVHG